MKPNENDKVITQYGSALVLKVEKEPEGPMTGRYTIQVVEDSRIISNYPGYLIKLIP